MQVWKDAPTTSSIHTFHDTSRSCAHPSLLLLLLLCPSRLFLAWLSRPSWLSWLSDSLLLQLLLLLQLQLQLLLLLQLLWRLQRLSLLWLWPPASFRPDMSDESVWRMEEHSRVSGGVEIVEWFLAKEICIAATGGHQRY